MHRRKGDVFEKKSLLYEIIKWMVLVSVSVAEVETVLHHLTEGWRHLLSCPVLVDDRTQGLTFPSIAKEGFDLFKRLHW